MKKISCLLKDQFVQQCYYELYVCYVCYVLKPNIVETPLTIVLLMDGL
jgi:hypothetical protein